MNYRILKEVMVGLVQLEINMKMEEGEDTTKASTENEELKPIKTNTSPSTENEEEVEDPYFHLRDGNYIGGLTMPS
jgi:hypothetical protein